MYEGERVVLRAVETGDTEQLWRWQNDAELRPLVDDAAPVPVSRMVVESKVPEAVGPTGDVEFAVTVDERLVGRCLLHSLDLLARSAAVGITIAEPAERGKGYGRDVLGVLLRYGFRTRNLRRLWLETLATNTPALRCYASAGFVEEGRLREAAWVEGGYVDAVRMSVLRRDWLPAGS